MKLLRGFEEEAYQTIKNAIYSNKQVTGISINLQEWNDFQDWVAGCEDEELTLLLDILPRFDIQDQQISNILDTDREKNNIYLYYQRNN